MICGMNVMMMTGMLEIIRAQVVRRDDHSSIGVPGHLEKLAEEARKLANAIAAMEKEAA